MLPLNLQRLLLVPQMNSTQKLWRWQVPQLNLLRIMSFLNLFVCLAMVLLTITWFQSRWSCCLGTNLTLFEYLLLVHWRIQESEFLQIWSWFIFGKYWLDLLLELRRLTTIMTILKIFLKLKSIDSKVFVQVKRLNWLEFPVKIWFSRQCFINYGENCGKKDSINCESLTPTRWMTVSRVLSKFDSKAKAWMIMVGLIERSSNNWVMNFNDLILTLLQEVIPKSVLNWLKSMRGWVEIARRTWMETSNQCDVLFLSFFPPLIGQQENAMNDIGIVFILVYFLLFVWICTNFWDNWSALLFDPRSLWILCFHRTF